MPQVNPNVPADTVQDTKQRTAPRNSVERGFGRQLEDEVHKLGASENSQAAPARNITVSDNQKACPPESQSEGAASSTTGIQDVQDDSPGPTGVRPIVRPATLKGITVPDGQSKDENVQGSGKNGADAGNLAASSVLAVLAVLLFSPIESAGQNLPTEASIPKDSATKPDSDGSKVAIAPPDGTSSVPAILHHKPVEMANQHLTYSSQMPFSEQQETPNQKSSAVTADTNQKAQAASVSSKHALASGAAGTADIAGVPLEVQLFNAQHSNPTGTKSSETTAIILESSDSSDPVHVVRSSVEAHSIDLQHSSDPSPDPLSSGASVISKSERYATTPAETAPAATEAKGSSDQLVQEEVQKLLTNLLSRNISQTKATTTPRIPVETKGPAQTPPLSPTTEQKVDTKLDKEVRDLALNRRGTIRTQKADLELQGDPIPPAAARTAGNGLENQIRSLGKVETTNLKLEVKEGAAGDHQESTASVARENLRTQSTSPQKQLADRREEAGSEEVAAQTDRTPKTEPAPRSSPKGEADVMTEERGEFGARSLTSSGHVTLSTSGPAGSGAEQAAAVPVASNVLEQVEKAKVIAQLVEKAHLIGGKNDGELVLSLKPEFLGRISLHASMVEKTLVATLVAESSHVKDLLESQLPVLQHSLQERGLPVAKVVVLQGNEFSFSDANKGQSNFQQNPEPHQATPRPYQHSDPLQETDEQELSGISPIPQRPYYSRSLNLIA